MSFVLSRNLRLRIDSGLTANAKYNLNRIDLIGSVVSTDTTQATAIRSSTDINIEPQATAVGGSGIGGSVNLGNSGHILSALNVYASAARFSSAISLLDSSTAFYLGIQHASSGTSTADRVLSLNLNNSNRLLSLSGDVSLAGALSTSGAFPIALTTTAPTTLTLPVTGTLVTLDGAEILTDKTITGSFTGPLTGNASGTSANITGIAAIANGGTGQSSLPAALNALLPVQTGNSGKLLVSDGTNANWVAAGGGSVTSIGAAVPAGFTVSGSPVTTAGTITIGLDTQSVGKLLVGPATGGDAAPTFRRLSVEDIPTGIDHSQLNALSLLNDDHTQYHTDGRALTWIGTRSTSDLAEGTNKYLSAANLGALSTSDLSEGTNLYYQDSLVDGRIDLQKAAVNGIATLDAGGKIPVDQLPSAIMSYQGNWNALTNGPELADGTGDQGDVYRVSVAGSNDLGSGTETYAIGDWVVYNGTIWQRSDNSDAVTSVNTFTGAVSLTTTNIPEGTSLYYTDTRVNARIYGSANSLNFTWVTADGTSVAIPHSLNTIHTVVSIIDVATGEVIFPDSIVSTLTSTTITSSSAPPATDWSVRISRQ